MDVGIAGAGGGKIRALGIVTTPILCWKMPRQPITHDTALEFRLMRLARTQR